MNLGFENGMLQWTPAAIPVLSGVWEVVDEPDTTEGSKCLRFSGDTRPAVGVLPVWVRIDFDETFYLQGATSITYAAWSRQTLVPEQGSTVEVFTPAQARLGVDWLDASGVKVASTYGINGRGMTEGAYTDFNWIRMEVEAPPDAVAFRIFLEARGPATCELMFDSVGVRVGDRLYGTDTEATFYKPYGQWRGKKPGDPTIYPKSSSTGVPVAPTELTQRISRTLLPHINESLVSRDGKMSRTFYSWAQAIDKGVQELAQKADEVKAGLDALPPALGSPDGTIASIPPPRRTTVRGEMSLNSTSIEGGWKVSLHGDVQLPGPTYYYGTNSLSERGWHTVASAFLAGHGITLDTDVETGVTEVSVSRPTLIASGAISALRAIVADGGNGRYPNTAVATDAGKVVGISVTAAADGEPFEVLTDGEWTDAGWAWSPGPVFCGADGVLTQTPPSGWVLEVGRALSATRLVVDVKTPFLRA